MMPVFGSHPGAALQLARTLFENAYMDPGPHPGSSPTASTGWPR